MPLKHHTETALVMLLMVVTVAVGIAASLLPDLPDGFLPWIIVTFATLLYPLVLWPTFKSNRADIEFRLLHLLPAIMMFLWILLAVLAPHFTVARILKFGFFAFWSMPMIALMTVFIVLFCSNVIRRQRERISFVMVVFLAFVLVSFQADARGWNYKLQANMFPKTALNDKAVGAVRTIAQVFRGDNRQPEDEQIVSSEEAVIFENDSSSAIIASATSTAPAEHSSSAPSNIPKTGPEHVGLLAVTLLAVYSLTLHRRAKERLEVDYVS